MLPWVPYWLVVVLQVICAIHLIKNRRNWMWMLAILMLPPIGALLYLWFEVRPGLRSGGGFTISLADLPGFERLRLRQLEEALAECDNIDNRYNLAAMYLQYDRAEDALAVLRPALDGPLKNNQWLMLAMARVEYANRNHQDALYQLGCLDAAGASIKRKERRLLAALARTGLGEAAAAEPELAALADSFDGEEARYRYARFLLDAGRRDEALAVAERGIAFYGRAERLYRRSEWRWHRGLKGVRSEARKPAAVAPPPAAPPAA